MKKTNRIFAFLFACLFSFGALAACDSDTPAPGTEGTTGAPVIPGTDTAPGHETEPPADEGPVISDAAKGITLATDEMVAQWEAMLEAKRQEILSTPNMDISGFKKVYYVSPNGDDSNDGLSPETAWKTVDKVNDKYMGKDTCVCFERGGIYRGKIVAKFGVTYTAYGEGPKPEIWGSPMNGAEVGTWEEVAPNIYRYSEAFTHDVGVIVMNGGEVCGAKITIDYRQDPLVEFKDGGLVGRVWEGYTSLSANYEFWHDMNGLRNINEENPGYIYMYCDEGNPGDLWEQIEFNTYGNVIEIGDKNNITIDNLTLKYGGSHGIGGGGFKNLSVTNCEIGWIGGSIQTYISGGRPIRYGNGVESYGPCANYTVDNCWIYQIYDSGVTFQYGEEFPEVSVLMDTVYFTNNLIEKCAGSFECWVAGEDGRYPDGVERCMKDIYITGNILADAGYGFSAAQRPDHGNETLFMGYFHWNNRKGDYVIENNLFLRSKFTIMNIGADHYEHLPELRNNVFVHTDKHRWGRYTQNVDGEEFLMAIYTYEEVSKEKYAGNEFYVLPYTG